MKTVKKNRQSKPLYLILALLIIAFLAGALYYYNYRTNNAATIDGPTAEEQKQATDIDNQKKKELTENTVNNTPIPPPSTPPTNANIELTAKEESNDTVTITSKLAGVSSGTCNIEISNGATKISRQVAVIYQPEFSTCAGFSIPISELGTGLWNILLTVNSPTGSSSKTINLKVT